MKDRVSPCSWCGCTRFYTSRVRPWEHLLGKIGLHPLRCDGCNRRCYRFFPGGPARRASRARLSIFTLMAMMVSGCVTLRAESDGRRLDDGVVPDAGEPVEPHRSPVVKGQRHGGATPARAAP